MKLPFGKYKGIHIVLVPSGHLKWLQEQDWFVDEYPDEFNEVELEYHRRDYEGSHFYEDKVKV